MSGGYEHAISTQLLATSCIFCGRPLRDPESIQRGWGPVCDEKYAGGLHGISPTDVDLDVVRDAMTLAPEPLRGRWREMGGDPGSSAAPWATDPEARREMLSVGLHHGAIAVSYGSDQLRTVRERVDAALLVIAAVQNFASGAGYHRVAEKVRANYTERLEREIIVFARSAKRPGAYAVHTPYNEQWLRVARANRTVFFASERQGALFFRYFHEGDMAEVVNMLQGVFGDVLCVNPDGNLVLLPSMPIPEVTEPAPAPTGKTARPTNEVPEVPDEGIGDIRIGDVVDLPDGDSSIVQYIDPKKKRVGVGPKKGRGYRFFSFTELEVVNGKSVARDIWNTRREMNQREGYTREPDKPSLPKDLPAGLYPWQVENVAFVEEHGRVLIADQMGLGKTLSAIVALQAPAIVVCPALLKVNWMRELNRWQPELSVSIVEGTKEQDPIVRDADVVVINYDILHAHVGWLMDKGARTVIADEAHYLKNLRVQWDKQAAEHKPHKQSPRRAATFYELHKGIPRRILLTGTPVMNRTKELFPLLHMLDANEWNSYFRFCQRYCAGHYEWIRARGGQKKVFNCDGRSNSDELHERVTRKYMIRHTKAEVLTSLPPKTRRSTTVSLSPQYKRVYARAAKDFIRWVRDHGGPDAVARASRAQALVQLSKLRAISARGKVDAAVAYIGDFIESTQRPLVMMGVHRDALDAVGEGLDKLNAAYEKALSAGRTPDISKPIRWGEVVGGMGARQRQAAIDAFQNDGALDVLLFSIPIATGVTLTRAQDMLFIERMWRPSDQVQAEDRLHRIGQENHVVIDYMDAEGTIDLKLGMLLMDKAETAAAVIDGADLSRDQASMLVFGEMFDMDIDVEDIVGDLATDVDESELLIKNAPDGDVPDVDGIQLDSSWDQPL